MHQIALLRGINLGSHNKLPMPQLKEILTDIGVSNIATYLQSGNAIFDGGITAQQLSHAIAERFQYDVAVIIKDAQEIERVVRENPFPDTDFLYVTFLAERPATPPLIPDKFALPDHWRLVEDVVYLRCEGGYGNTKLTNGFFERKLKVTATTRNWNTVLALRELGRNN